MARRRTAATRRSTARGIYRELSRLYWRRRTLRTSQRVPVTGVAAAPLGVLAGVAYGQGAPKVGVATAALGPLGGAAVGRRTARTPAAAALGALTGTASGRRVVLAHPAAAALGTLNGRATGAVTSNLGASGVPLNPSVWLVDETTGALTELPDWTRLVYAPIDNLPGELSLDYPVGGRSWAALNARVQADPQRDALIEIRLDGNGLSAARDQGRLQQKQGNDLVDGAIFTFTGAGRFQEWFEVIVGPQATTTKELIFSDAVTAGTILATAFDGAKSRSAAVLPGWTRDFTTAVDSAGQPWSTPVSDVVFAPDAPLSDVVALLVTLGLAETNVKVGPTGPIIQAWNYGTRGVDRSTGGAPLRFQHAANLREASRRESSRVGDAATAVLGKGAEGVYQWAVDATAEAQRGRRVEVVADLGELTSDGAVLAGATGQLDLLKTGVNERSHGLRFYAGAPIPRVDFDIGDTAISVTAGDFTPMRVRQYRLEFDVADDGGLAVTGDIVLNDLAADWEDRVSARLNAVQRGGAKVGTSVPGQELDDGKAPAQVLGVVALSSAYRDGDGTTWSSLTAGWSPVTTNADGTAADDIDRYAVQWRYTSTDLSTAWVSRPDVPAGTTQADWDSLVSDQPVQIQVAAIDRFERWGAWSAPYALTTAKYTDPPPVPSAPVASSYLGLFADMWDGLGAAGELMGQGFSHIEIHRSTVSNFTVNRPLNPDGSLDEDSSTTYLDRLFAAGTLPAVFGNYGDTYYFRHVAVSRDNVASAASAQASATLQQADDGDIAAVSIGKLTAGIMSALMTVSGLIRTATSGSRVELDADGIRCYLGTRLVLQFDIPSQVMSVVGKLISGSGIGSGATVVIDPGPPPRVRLYPNATAQHTDIYGESNTRPDGSTAAGFNIDTYNSSGQTDGFAVDAWSTNVWIGHRLTSGAFADGRMVIQRIGGLIGLFSGSSQVQVTASEVIFDGPTVRSSPAMGTTGAGFSQRLQSGATDGVRGFYNAGGGYMSFIDNQSGGGFMKLGDGAGAYKNFVIDHPTDPDRWLVHACIEAPEAAVEYRGVAVVRDGRAVVELPPYFEAATLPDGRTVHLTMLLPDEPLDREVPGPPPAEPRIPLAIVEPAATVVIPESAQVHTAAASVPRDGRFRIASSAPDGTQVAWLVKAVRSDGPPLVAEPLRAQAEVHGDGPYTYVTDRTQPS